MESFGHTADQAQGEVLRPDHGVGIDDRLLFKLIDRAFPANRPVCASD